MATIDRPTKTAEQVLALPIKAMFSEKIVVCDTEELARRYGLKLGDTVHIPIAERVSVTCYEPDDLIACWDEDGRAWGPVLRDGVWYREERIWLSK